MAANTISLMNELDVEGAFKNPHRGNGRGGYSNNQYAYTITGILNSIVYELQALGVNDANIGPLPDGPHPSTADAAHNYWTATAHTDIEGNTNNLFRYMTENDYDGGLLNSSTADSGDALSLDNLYLLANNMTWCWKNLYSFMAWTDFISGYSQFSDKKSASAAQELDYIPANHGWLSNNFTNFADISSLVVNYDSANTTINASSEVYTSINNASVLLISNSSPFMSNGFNSNLETAKAPTINNMTMWFYTANGTAAVEGAGVLADRPAGLAIDHVDGAHPAASQTPQAIYQKFLGSVNNYTYLIRGFIEDSPLAGNYEPLPGVTRANTFIKEAKEWVDRRAMALRVTEAMSRPSPLSASESVTNALANTAPINKPYVWAWSLVGETHSSDANYGTAGAAAKLVQDFTYIENVDHGLRGHLLHSLSVADGQTPYIEFYDDRATTASGLLNSEDALSGRYMHVVLDLANCPSILAQWGGSYSTGAVARNRFILYWVRDEAENGYIGIYAERANDPDNFFQLSGGQHVIVFDMTLRDEEVTPAAQNPGFWGPDTMPSDGGIHPLKIYPFFSSAGSAHIQIGADEYIDYYGFILADRILAPDEIDIPIDITKASS